MKTSPILFSSDMIRSLLAGIKKQTRRMQGLEQINQNPDKWNLVAESPDKFIFTNKEDENIKWYAFPKHIEGDILWVREAFCGIIQKDDSVKFHYKASVSEVFNEAVKLFWKPSIHMPKRAARIFLRVNNVRCERLQMLSETDAISEGVESNPVFDNKGYRDYFYTNESFPDSGHHCLYAHTSFKTLWMKINGYDSWTKNPWVFVYEFELIEKPENFLS